MRLNLFSHCVLDTIMIGDKTEQRQGGPACYCGLVARRFKFDVNLFTRFGGDFDAQILHQNGIRITNPESAAPTTRFEIKIDGPERSMTILDRCEPVQYDGSEADGALVSPVFDEVSVDLLGQITAGHKFVFLDPQGFLRAADSDGRVYIRQTELSLEGISAIKLNPDELQALEPGAYTEALPAIQKRGVEHVLYSDGCDISLLYKDRLYWLALPNKDIHDTTGIGDIFSAAYCCTMLKEKDFLWALCFASGAAQAALDSQALGLDKVPAKKTIETNASYFYNTVKFRHV